MASKAFSIREDWNPICHGNKTGMLILWSTSSRILLQRIKHFGYKLAEISFFLLVDQNSVGFMTYFKKNGISLGQKDIFENAYVLK